MNAMHSASVEDFEVAIRNMRNPASLKSFLSYMTDKLSTRESSESSFGSVLDRFTEACRNIIKDPNSPRLAGMLRRRFENAALTFALTDPSAGVAESAAIGVD
jgi:hypothetical protein